MAKKRQLAAIMFTDIAGYTALMQENERQAAAVRKRHRDVFQSEHKRHFGKVIQYYGDGTLSIFKSAVEAVECAISMQQAFLSGEKIDVRMGLHLGDIVFDENEIYGDGVNLASRVESLGVPGCILISDKLNFAVKNHDNISTESIGIFEFKNVSQPVEIFAVTNSGIIVPERAELKGKLKETKKSVAVLPFVNMSSDPENEYFSDGISEEILNALAKVEGLQVTARTSSFSFKGKNIDVREIGRQLGVAHILEGSVRKAGNRVRITAQLVSSVDGYHFFSETYDRNLEDIFAVQDEIAQKITNRLREHLGESQYETHLVETPTQNMEAYELYLKGLYFFNQWGEQAFGKAIPYFEKAIELQDDFALAHARLSLCYIFQAFGGIMTWEEVHNKSMVHINKVNQLNVKAPEVYFGQFIFNFFLKWDWQASIDTIKAWLEAFPNSPSLYHTISTIYYVTGELKKSRIAHKKGLVLDPLSIEMIMYMGIAYLWDEQYEKAGSYLDQVLEMVPTHRTAMEYKGWIAAFQGQYEQALEIFKKLEPEMGYRLHRNTCLGWVYYKMGKVEEAHSCLNELTQLEENAKLGMGLTLDLATLNAGMNNNDEALDYLEKAVRNKIGDSMMIRTDPFFDNLRKLPRFKDITDLIGEVPPFDL